MSRQEPSLFELADELASIKMVPFKVTSGLFFALAILSVLGRTALRVYARRPPTIDDYFVIFGCLCFISGASVVYANLNNMYMVQVIQSHDPRLAKVDKSGVISIRETMTYVHTMLSLLWTAIFAIKFSFLAFFRQLIQSMGNLRWWYWCVVVYSGISWVLCAVKSFMICSHVGSEAYKCQREFNAKHVYSLSALIIALDITTDLMIISIPILVLRQARMKLRQKIVIGSFTCLSVVMISLAIVRVSHMRGHAAIDSVYETYWLLMEAAIALLMVSLTSYRTFFVTRKDRRRISKKPAYLYSSRQSRLKEQSAIADDGLALPEYPSRATLTGMRTFIRHNGENGLENGSNYTQDTGSDKIYLKSSGSGSFTTSHGHFEEEKAESEASESRRIACY